MSLLTSPPQQRTPWRPLLLSTLVALALPAAIGAGLVGLGHLTGASFAAPDTKGFWTGAMLLALSPLLAGAGMLLAVPIASLLIRLGWFGWLPAAATGLAIGGTMAVMIANPLAAPFGLCSLLILRATLGRLFPMG